MALRAAIDGLGVSLGRTPFVEGRPIADP